MLTIIYSMCLAYDLRLGYCAPLLACPQALPISWLEIPRSGCTSQKTMLAALDNIQWVHHGVTSINCCTDEPHDRIKYAVVRHPYSRILSMYNHRRFCKTTRFKFCKKKLCKENLNDFFEWSATTLNKIKGDRFDKSHHLRTQLSYFYDERQKQPYNINQFLILKLETIDQGMVLLKNKTCVIYGKCNVSLEIPIANKLNANGSHDLSLLQKNKTVLNIINQHYAADFTVFGYKPFSPI